MDAGVRNKRAAASTPSGSSSSLFANFTRRLNTERDARRAGGHVRFATTSAAGTAGGGGLRRSNSASSIDGVERRRRAEQPGLLGDFSTSLERANDAVRAKVASAINNVKYGWMLPKPVHFKTEAAIWLLGRLYRRTEEAERSQSVFFDDVYVGKPVVEGDDLCGTFQDFIADFQSRLWFTYRDGFEALPQSDKVRSDAGWGCMLRCGQMIFAQGLVMHLLGRDWNVCSPDSYRVEYLHSKIIAWFSDQPEAPFSIHALCRMSRTLGKGSGDWFGPGFTLHLIRKVFDEEVVRHFLPEVQNLALYVASDCTVSLEEVECLATGAESSPVVPAKECFEWLSINETPDRRAVTSSQLVSASDTVQQRTCENGNTNNNYARDASSAASVQQRCYPSLSSFEVVEDEEVLRDAPREVPNTPADGWRKAMIIFIPLRLGSDRLNAVYFDNLKYLFTLDYFLGIVGGKPKTAMYFVGRHADSLIYLDPHFCQDYVDMSSSARSLKSFHCSHPKLLPCTKMDPSCALAFYIRDRRSFEKFKKDSLIVNYSDAPLYTIVERKDFHVSPLTPRSATKTSSDFELL